MVLEIGGFLLDPGLRELTKNGQVLLLEPKALDLLILLAENPDRVVSRDEIFDKLWQDVIVTDASLSTAIAQIRKAFGDTGRSQNYIKTVRGFGFRLVAEVNDYANDQSIVTVDEEAHPAVEKNLAGEDSRPMLAVLPFKLLGVDQQHYAIAEAIPAELISSISKLRWLRVIARGSSFRFNAAELDMEDIRSKLGAEYVLSGSVELAESNFRLYVELTDARNHVVVWCNHFTGSLDQVFEIRERIARDIVSLMELHIPLHEAQRLALIPSENLDAWGHYHLGVRHMYRYNRKDNDIAREHFTQAVQMDPNFARAHAGLSYTEFQNYFQKFGQDLKQHRSSALRYAETALALDPLDPYGNLILGRAKWLHEDIEGGLQYIDRALELNPNYSFAYYNSATLNTVLCRSDIADDQIDTSLLLSPIDPHLQSMWGIRALAAFVRNDLSAADDYIQRALRSPNTHLYVYAIAALIYCQIGDDIQANVNVEQIRIINNRFSSAEFLTHFNLRDPEVKRLLVDSFARLGF